MTGVQTCALPILLDGKRELDNNDFDIIKSLEGKKTIAIINKTEDGVAFDKNKIDFEHIIEFSVKTGKGYEVLEDTVSKLFGAGDIAVSDEAVITSVRHKDALTKAKTALSSAVDAIENGIEHNMTFIDIEDAISALGEITGQTVAEEIVDRIFHSFCVGK